MQQLARRRSSELCPVSYMERIRAWSSENRSDDGQQLSQPCYIKIPQWGHESGQSIYVSTVVRNNIPVRPVDQRRGVCTYRNERVAE